MPAYPPYIARQISYRQNESAGNEIPTATLDAEINDIEEVMNQINRRVRAITNVSGQLINVAAQIAMALVGTQRFAPSGSTTVFLTTITWDSSFSNGNVLVSASGLAIDPNKVAVANNGGFLQVTLTDAVSSGWVSVAAYSQGAGILTRLGALTTGDGASLVGIEDVGNLYSAVEVEGALQEIATELAALISTLGTLSKIWTSDGETIAASPATDDFKLGGFKITGMADAVSADDAVTLQQLQAITQNLDTLLGLFVRADGTVPFTGDQSMGAHRLTNLGAAVMNGDAVRFEQFNNIDGAQITTGTIPGIRLGVFGGATGSVDGTAGAVPAPIIADFTGSKFLSANGSFEAVPSNLGHYILLQDQKAAGTNGGTSIATTWTARTLNTEVVDTGGDCALVGTTQFTLQAGTYRIKASAPFLRDDVSKLRLWSTTDAAVVVVGAQGYSNASASYAGDVALLSGRFVITVPTTFELQYWVNVAFAGAGLGSAAGAGQGEVEVFATVELIKE